VFNLWSCAMFYRYTTQQLNWKK